MVQKFYVKVENIYCEWSGPKENRWLKFTASGVRTYLNGYRANYSKDNMCRQVTESGIERKGVGVVLLNPKSFPCTAARKLGKYLF